MWLGNALSSDLEMLKYSPATQTDSKSTTSKRVSVVGRSSLRPILANAAGEKGSELPIDSLSEWITGTWKSN
jgi:hypothetical protein